MNVTADFLEDVREKFLDDLTRAGFDTKRLGGASVSDVAFTYFNVRHRLPSTRARPVYRSRQLLERSLESEIAVAVDAIVDASERGASLGPYLHTKLTTRPAYHDLLLNAWGVYHFHVGSPAPLPGKRHVEGRSELLFGYVTATGLYLIDLRDHDAFEDVELVEILHANWPEAIAQHRAKGLAEPDEAYVSHGVARAKRFNMLIRVADGRLYFPPGGAYTANGGSMRARIDADRLLNRATEIQEHRRGDFPAREPSDHRP